MSYTRKVFVVIGICLMMLFLYPGTSLGTIESYSSKSWTNMTVDGRKLTVFSVFEDSRGLIWLGTNSGLYFFDGINSHSVGKNELLSIQIFSIKEQNGKLYLASNNGLYRYSFKDGRYEQIGNLNGKDLRCLMLVGDQLWVGGLEGLFSINTTTGQSIDLSKSLPDKAVYCLYRDSRGIIYAGTYSGLARWDSGSKRFVNVPLVINGHLQTAPFVNCLLESPDLRSILVGTEGHLYTYTPSHDTWNEFTGVKGNNVKCLYKSRKGSVLVGTEDGLLELSHGHVIEHRHDSRFNQTLAGSEIWCAYTDSHQNIWIGHEKGFSVSSDNLTFKTINLGELTQSSLGNDILTIYKDSRKSFWFGGTNGVILMTGKNTKWYRHNSSPNSLSHNHVRYITEDTRHHVWLCTDNGIDRYAPGKDGFDVFHVTDKQGNHSTNWVYSICENGRFFWIGSFIGGIHQVDKERFGNSSASVIADYSYNQASPFYKGKKIDLRNDFIGNIVKGADNSIWVLYFRDNRIIVFDNNGKTEYYDIHKISGGYPTHIASDSKGRVWCAYKGGVVMFNRSHTYKVIKFPPTIGDESVLAIARVGDDMWVSTQSSLWKITGDRLTPTLLPIPQRGYTAIYYDSDTKKVFLGGTDEMTEVNVRNLQNTTDFGTIRMVLLDNGEGAFQLADLLKDTRKLTLPYRGALHLIVSTLNYGQESVQRYAYKLARSPKDLSGGWIVLPEGVNTITLSDVSMGNYVLLIKVVGSTAAPISIPLSAMGPWYLSWWAILLEVLLLIAFVLAFVLYIYRRHAQKVQREIQKKELANAEKKLTFLTNISHDLKTPLSMILGPVSVLREKTKDKDTKNTLDLVYDNAVKLNNMIHRSLELHRLNDDDDSMLILSSLDVVDFCKVIFNSFKENNNNKRFVFHSSFPQLWIEADAVKLESVITNLLSNACKYSEDGATISCGIDAVDDMVEIIVSDNGMGIAEEDQHLVFQRLFRSPSTAKLREGTGIGLYLIKKYIELMKGTIDMYSRQGQGTTFTIHLPISKEMKQKQMNEYNEEVNAHLPKVLIVEDNLQIATFIKSLIQKDYTCMTAENGRTGLSLASSFLPDLIVLDEMMPIMSGTEMVKSLKQIPRLAHIPIIMLTAKSDNNTENESIKLGVDAFMSKPFEPQVLISRIRQLIKARKEIQSSMRIEAITEAKPIEAESPVEKQLAKIAEVIEENISDSDMNVNFVCEKTGIPNKQLYRLIKKHIGITPLDYIRRVRLQKAAMLLEQQRFTVSEIAYMVGFGSPSYFAKCFQKEFSVKPSEYSSGKS